MRFRYMKLFHKKYNYKNKKTDLRRKIDLKIYITIFYISCFIYVSYVFYKLVKIRAMVDSTQKGLMYFEDKKDSSSFLDSLIYKIIFVLGTIGMILMILSFSTGVIFEEEMMSFSIIVLVPVLMINRYFKFQKGRENSYIIDTGIVFERCLYKWECLRNYELVSRYDDKKNAKTTHIKIKRGLISKYIPVNEKNIEKVKTKLDNFITENH